MSLKERVKQELKRGDVQRISEIIGVTHSGATSVLGNENFDSIKYIFAICKVTGKPFEYFLTVYDEYMALIAGSLDTYNLKTFEELLAAYKEEKKEKAALHKELVRVKSALIDALEVISVLKEDIE